MGNENGVDPWLARKGKSKPGRSGCFSTALASRTSGFGDLISLWDSLNQSIMNVSCVVRSGMRTQEACYSRTLAAPCFERGWNNGFKTSGSSIDTAGKTDGLNPSQRQRELDLLLQAAPSVIERLRKEGIRDSLQPCFCRILLRTRIYYPTENERVVELVRVERGVQPVSTSGIHP